MGIADGKTQRGRSFRDQTNVSGTGLPTDPSDRASVSTTAAAAIDALTAIGGYLEASRHVLEQGGEAWRDTVRSALDKAHAQTMRACSLVKQMRDAAEKDED